MKSLLISALMAGVVVGAPQSKPTDVPADFSGTVQVAGELGAATGIIKFHIDRYTAESDRMAMVKALRTDGYQAFLPAFRKLPPVGYIQIKDQKWNVKWAVFEPKDLGAHITIATDEPVFFVGGSQPDAKPRAGYEMSVTEMDIDTIGMGKGTFAGAARVKPSANGTSVTVDDYSGKPSQLTMITRTRP
ncbi:MAG TPA: hypothetical protein VGG73_07730 [Vicinamibacterales bacterium]|jgi:hypothetical protein